MLVIFFAILHVIDVYLLLITLYHTHLGLELFFLVHYSF
jgi:hypothetical protein